MTDDCIELPDAKTGGRVVPLGPEARAVLASLPRRDDNPWDRPQTPRGQGTKSLCDGGRRLQSGYALPPAPVTVPSRSSRNLTLITAPQTPSPPPALCRLRYDFEVHGELCVITAQPLFGSFHVGTKALQGQPKLSRMVRNDQMHDLVRN